MDEKMDTSEASEDSEIPLSDDENSNFDIFSSIHVKVKEEFVLEYPKNGHKFISENAKRTCKVLKFTNDWEFQEIVLEIESFQQSIFHDLLAITFEVEIAEKSKSKKTVKRRKIDETKNHPVKKLFDVLAKFSKNRPFIVQRTMRTKNVTKLHYKDENSDEFQSFYSHYEQPKNIKNFQHFLSSFIIGNTDNFEDSIIEILPNVKNLGLIWKFCKTLDLPENFFNKAIFNCAAKGTKDQLLTILDERLENGIRSVNKRTMRSLTMTFQLDISSQSTVQSIFSIAMENSNAELIKFLIEECSFLIAQLPFNHQVAISTAALIQKNEDILIDLIETCDFPFPNDFDAASVEHTKLKKLISDREEFHEILKTGNVESIKSLISKFTGQKTSYGLETQEEEEKVIKNYAKLNAYKLTFLIPKEIEQEMIVRVVDILAYFHGDNAKIKELKTVFANLFQFYSTHVHPKFENFKFQEQQLVQQFNGKTGTLRDIKKFKLEFQEPQNFGLFENRSIVTTNIPKLLLLDIYKNFHPKGSAMFESENVVMSAENLAEIDLKEDLEDILYKNIKVNIFVDCTRTTDMTTNWIVKCQNQNIIFITSCEDDAKKLYENKKIKNAKKMEINYDWRILSIESRVLLLTTKFNFQNDLEYSTLDLALGFQNQDVNEYSNILQETSQLMDVNLLHIFVEKVPIAINITKNVPNIEFDVLNQERFFILEDLIQENNNESRKLGTTYTLDQLLDETSHDKYILIADKAGSGKSWGLLSIKNRINKINPTKWVTYVDLKQFIDAFKTEEKKLKSTNSELDFASFMIEHILNKEIGFGKKLFCRMYKIGKVVILFDGFDEIAPDCAEFVSRLAQSFVQNGNNQLWIATRDHFKVNLKQKLKLSVSYRLKECSKEDGEKLIAKIWALNDMKEQNYHIKSKDDFQEKFIELNAKNIYQSKARDLIENVSNLIWISIGVINLYKILADVGRYNINSIEKLTEYLMYDKFIDMHYKIWAHEKGQIRTESSIRIQKQDSTFTKFHQHQAMEILAPEFAHLCDVEYDEDEWSDVDIIGCGLMTKKDGKFFFIHRTFAEFLVANFITQMLIKLPKMKQLKDEFITLVTEIIKNNEKFVIVRMFVNSSLGENERLKKLEAAAEANTEIIQKVGRITEHMDIFDLIYENYGNCQKLHNLGRFINLGFSKENYENVKKRLFDKIKSEMEQSLEQEEAGNSQHLTTIAELLTKVAASFLKFEVFEYLIKKIKDDYGSKFIKIIFTQKFAFGSIFSGTTMDAYITIQVFLMSMELNTDKFQKLIEILKNYFTISEIIDMMMMTDEIDSNIFQSSISLLGIKQQFTLIWRAFEKILEFQNSTQIFREFIMKCNKYDNNILHCAAMKCKNLDFHETLWELLLKKFENHRDELWISINQKCKLHKRNFIYNLFEFIKTEIIQFTLKTIKDNFGSDKLLELLTNYDKDGRNVLHHAALQSSSENFEFLINYLQELTSYDDIRKMMNNVDYSNQNVLQLRVKSKKIDEIQHLKCLWNCLKKCFQSSEILNYVKNCNNHAYNFLHLTVIYSTKECIEFQWNEILMIMKEDDKFAEKYSERINHIEQYIKSILQKSETYKIANFKYSKKEIERQIETECLDLSWIDDKNLWIFKQPAESFEEHLNQETLFKIPTDLNNLAECPDLEIHKISWKFLLEKFKKREELIKFVMHECIYGNNYIHRLMCNENIEIIKYTLKIFNDNFNKTQIREILASKGFYQRNLLQIAISSSKSVNVYKIIWNAFSEYFDELELEDFTNHKESNGNCIFLSCAHWGSKEVFEFIFTEMLKKLKISSNDLIRKITKLCSINNDDILHISFKVKNYEMFEYLWIKIESSCESSQMFRKFCMQKNDNEQTLLHYAAEYCEKISSHKVLWKLLLKTFENHRDELWNFSNQTFDFESKTFIHLLVTHCKTDLIDFVLEIINKNFGKDKFLDFFRESNSNVLFYAGCWSPIENFKFLIAKLEEIASHDDIKGMLNIKITDLLLETAKNNNSLEFHNYLWNLFQKYFNQSEILNIIKCCDKIGYNLLNYAVEFNTEKISEYIWNQIKIHLNKDEQFEYLELTEKAGGKRRYVPGRNIYKEKIYLKAD